MAKHWAIAVGINAYQQFQPLSYAQHDAEALRQCWIDRGLPPEQCLLLTSMSPPIEGHSTFPDRESMHYWLQWLTEVALAPGDRLWIFFSGYGVCEAGQDYWMPIEGDSRSAAATGVSLASLYQRLKASAIDALVMVDMNRNEGSMAQAVGNQTALLAKDCGIPTMLSCMPEQYSREALELRHGLFATALLEGLGQESVLTLADLDRFVADRLEELCDHYWRPLQRAWTIGDLPLWSIAAPLGPSQSIVLPLLPAQEPVMAQAGASEVGGDRATWATASPILLQPIDPLKAAPRGPRAEAGRSPAIPSNTTRSGVGASGSDRSGDRQLRSLSKARSPWADGRALIWMGLLGVACLALAALRGESILNPDSVARVQEQSVTGSVDSSPKAGTTGSAPPVPVTSGELPSGELQSGELPSGDVKSDLLKPMAGKPPVLALAAGNSQSSPQVQTSDRAAIAFTGGASPAAAKAPLDRSTQSIVSFPPSAQPSVAASSAAKSAAAPRSPQVEAARKLLRTNQASQFNQAIAQLRQIKPNDPGYEESREDMNRWSRTIYDLAAGRAEQGDYLGAIAAARLVPSDLSGTMEARASLGQWQQLVQLQQRNSQDLRKAKALIRPHKASTYSNAIGIARRIGPGQPQAFEAQRLSSQWSTEIWNIAQARARGREWDLAIAAAQLVPADSPHHSLAKNSIKTWRGKQ